MEKLEKALTSLDKAIYESTQPPIIPQIFVRRFGSLAILIIEVSSGMNKPYYRRKEGLRKGTYIRLGRSTIRATPEIIEELKWQSNNIDFEALPVYQAMKTDLNPKKIKKFLEHRKNHGRVSLTDQTLESYHLIIKEHGHSYPTVAGILSFGIDPQKYFSEAMLICTHFKGNSGREVLATIDCEGTLFEQFDQAYQFITKRLHRSFTITGLQRKESLEIPEIAIREALLNAILHRNYHIKAPVKLAIFDDRLEIFSPGQFLGPINVDHLLTGITYLRNPAICKILREAGYVEKLGTGLITIFESYKKRNLETPTVIEGENYIKYILPRKASSFVMKEDEEIDEHQRIFSLFDSHYEITLADVMNQLNVSRATAARRLKELLDAKQIRRMGKTRAVRYRLNQITSKVF